MVEVVVLPDGARITTNGDETVLAALGRAGFRYRVGCRRGGCGICKVNLKLGEVRYERPIADTVLTDDERVDGICLSCRRGTAFGGSCRTASPRPTRHLPRGRHPANPQYRSPLLSAS